MTLRDAACDYMARGWHVFPCYPRTKQPHGQLVPQGYKEASGYPPDALYFWSREPKANIGLACRKSGIVVLDVDPRHGGDDSWWNLCKELGEPPAPRAETATGGSHYFFLDPSVEFKKEIAPGVDIKSNGYVVLAPSELYTGRYEWDWERPLGAVPDNWLERMVRPSCHSHARVPLTPSETTLGQIPAVEYVEALTGQISRYNHAGGSGGWFRCPFHKEGKERTASLKVEGTMWSCFGCEPMMDKQVMGGNIVDFAAILWGYAVPVRGIDLREVMDRLHARFEPC